MKGAAVKFFNRFRHEEFDNIELIAWDMRRRDQEIRQASRPGSRFMNPLNAWAPLCFGMLELDHLHDDFLTHQPSRKGGSL